MARYIKDFEVAVPQETVFNSVYQYLLSEGYEYTQYENEPVFKKGMGIMSSPTFIKISFSNNIVRLEAWVKYALFPGVYVGEFGITGFFLWAVKAFLQPRVATIEQMLWQYSPSVMAAAAQNQQQPPQQ